MTAGDPLIVIEIYPVGFPVTPAGALASVSTPAAGVLVAVFNACISVAVPMTVNPSS